MSEAPHQSRVERRLVPLLAFGLLLLLGCGLLSLWNVRRLVEASDRATHLGEVISAEQDMLLWLAAAEAEQLRAAHGARDAAAASYREATNRVAEVMTGLAGLLAREGLGGAGAEELGGMVRASLESLASGGAVAGEGPVKALRARLEQRIRTEREILAMRHRQSDAWAQRTLVVDWAFGVTSLGLLAGAFVSLLRENRQRRRSEWLLLGAKGELESRVKERTASLESSNLLLKESEGRLRAILQTAVEGIITIDDRGRMESVNPAAERIFGYAAAELIGRNVSVLMPSPYQEEHDGYLEHYCRTGEARIIGRGREVTGRRKDGTVFPMDLSVSEVPLPGRRLFTGVVRDITARKEGERRLAELAQTLEEKNRELETMVYIASHDLRSPLVNIQGFSRELSLACVRIRELLAEGGAEGGGTDPRVRDVLEAEVPEALGYIQAGVTKMDALLSGFLRFSRLGRAALRPERLDMRSLIREVLAAMDYQVKRSGVRIELGELPDCWGDAVQVNQVFSNLVDNAIKYLDPARAGRIEIGGVREGDMVVYRVRDNGIGIAPGHQGKVFEMFHRLDPSRGEGEGLGLSIAQRILQRMGGRIWVESQAGVGSTFFVSLPVPSAI